MGLVCAEGVAEVDNEANEQTICIPDDVCGVETQYEGLGGVIFDIEGYTIEDGACRQEELVFGQDESCEEDAEGCGAGLQCVIWLEEKGNIANL